MRAVLRIAVFVLVLWTAYWGTIWLGLTQGLPRWLEARQAEGWQAEAANLSVSGFPAAFRTEIRDLALADPETGLAWTAPVLFAEAVSWQPWTVQVKLPPVHEVSTPEERITVTSERMEAALSLAPAPDLAVTGATIRLAAAELVSTRGWNAGLGKGTLVASRVEGAPLEHDIFFSADEARPATASLRVLDPAGLLPPILDRMELEARVAFDAPWDRHAIEDRRPQPRRVELKRSTVVWGDMELEAAGTLEIDDGGVPEGRIALRAVNWREMLEIAAAGGWVAEGLRPTVERALEVLAGLAGGPETIDAPLTFQGGFMSFGPIPLGPAPRFAIR